MARGLSYYKKRVDALQKSTRRAREKAGELVDGFVRSFEVAGTAFGFGLLQGMKPDFDLFGVPPDLAVGIGAHAFALFGTGSDDHVKAIGDGALAAYTHTLGRGLGAGRRGVQGEDYHLLGEGHEDILGGDELDVGDYEEIPLSY